MKKLLNMLALTLALNFLAVAGSIGWLYQSGRLDRQKARLKPTINLRNLANCLAIMPQPSVL